jgi:hypothetical protein
MAIVNAASASLANVQSAIASASVGDTVVVPAGSATWTNQLAITKGINLIGAGIGKTVITSNVLLGDAGNPSDKRNFLVVYEPATPATNDPFRLSGFTLDCNNVNQPVILYNYSTDYPISRVRIDHNSLDNSKWNSMVVKGHVYGVVDNNVLGSVTHSYGCGPATWNNVIFNFGSTDQIYFEYNTFNIQDTVFAGENAGRYCVRYNTFNAVGTASGFYPLFDLHGNQGANSCSAMMGGEIYENVFNLGSNQACLFHHRGGKALCYNNTINTTGTVSLKTDEEHLDSLGDGPAINPISGQPQHISDSYYWNNRKNGTTNVTYYVQSTTDYGGSKGLVPQHNREFWWEGGTFNGTSGVGFGLLAARPATCTTGVGYWATDTKTLYRAAATNTWEEYYKPYTYPHPLREEGEEMANKTISFNLVVTAASDFFLAVAPASLEINPGNTATFTISVTGAGGYNKQLRFTASGVPAGCSATFSPVTIGAGQSTVLTIITPGTLSIGTYAITATATEV